MRPQSRAAGVVAAVVIALAPQVACGGGDDDTGGAVGSGAQEEPQRGGTLVYLSGAEAQDLYPDTGVGALAVGGSSGADTRFALYDALALPEPDGGVLLRIAESIASDDAVTWTVTLRPGVRFTDGTPFDAAAVAYNWERIGDPATGSPSAALVEPIEALEVVDERTLTVRLREPDAAFPNRVANTPLTFVGSPTALEEMGPAFGEAPVGAGAFMLTEWVRGDRKVFDRNPDFYGDAYLDRLVIRTVADEAQRFNALRSGGGDLDVTTDVRIADQAESDDGLTVAATESNGGRDLAFNVTRPPFDDPRARRAIALAYDREEANQALFGGRGRPADTLFAEGSPYHDPEVTFPGTDADEAQRLLDEVADEAGEPLRITFLAPESIPQQPEWFQAWLGDFENVEVDVEVLPSARYVEALRSGDFQVAWAVLRFTDAETSLENYLRTGGAQNYVGYSDPRMDDALDTLRRSQRDEDRASAHAAIQALLIDDLPRFLVDRLVVWNISTPSVKGLEMFADGVPRWDRLWLAG